MVFEKIKIASSKFASFMVQSYKNLHYFEYKIIYKLLINKYLSCF